MKHMPTNARRKSSGVMASRISRAAIVRSSSSPTASVSCAKRERCRQAFFCGNEFHIRAHPLTERIYGLGLLFQLFGYASVIARGGRLFRRDNENRSESYSDILLRSGHCRRGCLGSVACHRYPRAQISRSPLIAWSNFNRDAITVTLPRPFRASFVVEISSAELATCRPAEYLLVR
jgi:hypothetical protein